MESPSAVPKTVSRDMAGRTVPLAIAAALSLVAAGVLGYYLGAQSSVREQDQVAALINKDPSIGASDQVDFDAFWKAWNILNERFVGSTTPSDQEKVYGAIAGLADSMGDPYTVFFPPVEKKEFEEEVRGQFEGVGMEIGIKDEVITVVAPLRGNPAERAGVKAGDKILKIDDALTAGLAVDEAVQRIRGAKGTPVRLTLFRQGTEEPFDLTIIRDTISIPTVESDLRQDGSFVIRVHNFSSVVVDQFREALRQFIVSKSGKLVIDLRGNPGGYLEAAVEMASYFLPQGLTVVSEDRGGHGEGVVYRSRGYDIFSDDLKLVVLVDGGSASASEIFAGALRDHKKAVLIGTKTFGKGSVQELVPITDDTALKVTIARWLTPAGTSISGDGVAPDIEVPYTAEDAKNAKDPQLDRAVEWLMTGK